MLGNLKVLGNVKTGWKYSLMPSFLSRNKTLSKFCSCPTFSFLYFIPSILSGIIGFVLNNRIKLLKHTKIFARVVPKT